MNETTGMHLGAESGADAQPSQQSLRLQLEQLQAQQGQLGDGSGPWRKNLLQCGFLLLDLDGAQQAHEYAHQVLAAALADQSWEEALQACDLIYRSEQGDSVAAIAHGIWLGVTYPIDPALSVTMLQHMIEETPDNSDGAAVAAATACYLTELRANDEQREELGFFTNQLLGQVARRHSAVADQEAFQLWVKRLELDDPEAFLPRLAQVLDLLVEEGAWWFDRDRLRQQLPSTQG